MGDILMVGHMKIHPGKRAEFDAAVKKIHATLVNEPGTLQNDWYVADDGTTVTAIERYADSDALLSMMAVADSAFPALMECVDMDPIDLFGELSDKAREATADYPMINHGSPAHRHG